MEIFGKATINPFVFLSGKILGYCSCLLQILLVFDIKIIEKVNFAHNYLISFVIFFVAMFFVIFSLINLGKSTRFGLPTNDTKFKTKGLYKISRNPMYIGINLLTVASMVYTLSFVVIAIGIYSIFVYHLIILRSCSEISCTKLITN
jgi:protein-S-isoprenylcysteine O-methyltransferase Ste14